MLPFQYKEMARYGLSWMFLRLVILRISQGNAIRKADGMIFLSQFAQSTISKKVRLANEVIIIPHGIGRGFIRLPDTQKTIDEYSFERPYRLLYVSIIDVYKHQWHVAESVNRLRKKGFPVALDLIGSAHPPALKRLRKILNELDPGQSYIRYLGPKPYKDISQWYHGSDAFIYASSCENLPIILLEAMAAGLPIACSNKGPMREVLGKAGVYFDPEKPIEIAEAVRKLLVDPALRARCAKSAYDQARKYSWEQCAAETFAFLAKVAKRGVNKKK
jgi:glycosyltransferase involved in cell wall biosynthesis